MILALSSFALLIIHSWPKKVEIKILRVEKFQTPVVPDSTSIVKNAIMETIKNGKAKQAKKKSSKKPEKPKIVEETPQRMETRSQAAKKNTPPENNHGVRMFSPGPEFYSRLSKLRLSSATPEPTPKPTNEKNIIKPAKLGVDGNQTPSPPWKNCFTSSDPLTDMNICKFAHYPIDYDYGPCNQNYFQPVTHAAFSYSFRPAPMQYGRLSPPFASPFDSTNSSNLSDSFPRPFAEQKNKAWEWAKWAFCISSAVLNMIAIVFFFDEVRRRMF